MPVWLGLVIVVALTGCTERALLLVPGEPELVDLAPDGTMPMDLSTRPDLFAPADLALDLALAPFVVEPAIITVPAGRDQPFVAPGATGWSVSRST
jgi:hypothetical protein